MKLENALIVTREDLVDQWKNWSEPVKNMFNTEVQQAYDNAVIVIFIDDNPNAWKKMNIIKNNYAPRIGYV